MGSTFFSQLNDAILIHSYEFPLSLLFLLFTLLTALNAARIIWNRCPLPLLFLELVYEDVINSSCSSNYDHVVGILAFCLFTLPRSVLPIWCIVSFPFPGIRIHLSIVIGFLIGISCCRSSSSSSSWPSFGSSCAGFSSSSWASGTLSSGLAWPSIGTLILEQMILLTSSLLISVVNCIFIGSQ